MLSKKKRIIDRDFLDSFHDLRCSACSKRGTEPAHIKTRGSGGDDVWENLLPLCRLHHSMQHQIGWLKFATKFESVLLDLKARGWVFNEFGKMQK